VNPVCKQIRKDILASSHASGHGHIPTSFSVVEAIYAAYQCMNHDPRRPDWPERDLFVLSKGHAALGYYCVLGNLGYFDVAGVRAFGGFESRFGCHPDRTKVPGVEVSTGSLGHGIGVAVGMALAQKIGETKRRVYTLVGDGESNEGTVWEAVAVASHLKLDNLVVIYDDNQSQGRCLPIPNPAERFHSFGCDVVEVAGHDVDNLKTAMRVFNTNVRVVVAHTEKGHGCPTLVEKVYEWHRRSPKADELQMLLAELG